MKINVSKFCQFFFMNHVTYLIVNIVKKKFENKFEMQTHIDDKHCEISVIKHASSKQKFT